MIGAKGQSHVKQCLTGELDRLLDSNDFSPFLPFLLLFFLEGMCFFYSSTECRLPKRRRTQCRWTECQKYPTSNMSQGRIRLTVKNRSRNYSTSNDTQHRIGTWANVVNFKYILSYHNRCPRPQII
jgi:hypothetical protein